MGHFTFAPLGMLRAWVTTVSVLQRMAIGIGLDVGGTKILGCALDEQGKLLVELRVATPRTAEAFVLALAECVASIRTALGVEERAVQGVGVGVPGLVDRSGMLHETANLYGIQELDVAALLHRRLVDVLGPAKPDDPDAPWHLVVDNDATCATAAEHAWGAGRGHRDSVLVTLGTGIGGGIVADGRIVRGERNFAGEIGHCIVDPRGPLCGCGQHGCWERYASGTGIADMARRLLGAGGGARLLELCGGDPGAITSEHVVIAAQQGDPDAAAVIEEFGLYLSIGLGNIAEMLDPGCIILGGGLVAAAETLLRPGLDHFARTHRRGAGPRRVPVVYAELGERAGAFGAAAQALGVLA